MTSFPTYQFSNEFTKVRFLEDNAPAAINERFMGMPRGVYLGFIPSVTPGSDILTLGVDPQHGFSLLKVGSQTRSLQIDLFASSPLLLDFSGHTQWPVYIIGRADWRDYRPTQARVISRTTPATGPKEVTICKVDKPAADLVVETLFPGSIHPPIAFDGQTVGFMQDNAINDLVLGNSATAEIIASRTSTHTGAAASLKERIDADLEGSSLADRLGLRSYILVSNVKAAVTGATTNVAGSFIATQRTFEPKITIEPNADEATEGAITAPSDITRNICFLVDGSNGRRIVDTDGEPVFGTLSFSNISLAPGKQIRFYNALRAVNGSGTNPFQAPLQEGDAVKAPDGKFYEIEEFIDTDNALLGTAYQGPGSPAVATWNGIPWTTPVVGDPEVRQFVLSFFTAASGSVSLTDATIQFGFPAFFRTDRTIYDGFSLLKKDGELPPVPDATASVTGKAKLAASGGKVGSIQTIAQAGATVGNDVHTVNFYYGDQPGSKVQDAGLGVCEVSIIGATGAAGADADRGPKGDTGDPGYGYTSCNQFVSSGWSNDTTTPAPWTIDPATQAFTVDFSALSPSIGFIRHLWGGFAAIQWTDPGNNLKISSISRLSNTQGRISVAITGSSMGGSRFKVYLGAAE